MHHSIFEWQTGQVIYENDVELVDWHYENTMDEDSIIPEKVATDEDDDNSTNYSNDTKKAIDNDDLLTSDNKSTSSGKCSPGLILVDI